jgi:hypothetical protein
MVANTFFQRLLAQCLIARSAREDRALVATAFLSHSQTKSVSARSFVQASGARSWALLNPPSSSSLAEEQRLRSLLLTTAARDSRRSQPGKLTKMISYGRPRQR